MAKKKGKKRRQSHGLAWHWRQTDSWYYTMPGTRKRVPLFDEDGERIQGKKNKEAAQLALARIRLAGTQEDSTPPPSDDHWLVGKVCSEYIQHCERSVASGSMSKSHLDSTTAYLNDLCKSCGALELKEFKKGHLKNWLESHATWKSPATHRGVIGVVLAAFNFAESMYDMANPIKGYKKPRAQPRLHSISPEDEQIIYDNTDDAFGNFIFADMHTGLRPFCELAKITADDIEENERGMMWRVYSSKNKKTRKIPVQSEVATLTRTLMLTAPKGSGTPIFRNSRDGAWKKVAGVTRFLTLKKKLGWDKDKVKTRYSCYSCRHTFAHRMLSGYWNDGAGCSIEVLAELIGDTPKVAFDHYGREWGQHYQDPLWAAIGVTKQAG